MAMINWFQVPSGLKPATRFAASVALVGAVAAALPACSGESALFARDGAGDVPYFDVGGDGQASGDVSGSDGGMDVGMDGDTGASCSKDADCAATQFCSAGACVPRFGNLAGNGDLEYGSTAGWYGVFGGGGTLVISDTTAAGYAHGGRYSAQSSFRTQPYHGPAYRLPSGPGRYTISGWAFQKDDASIGGNFQVAIICATTIQYLTPATAALTQNLWTRFTGTFDTTAVAPTPAGDCSTTGTTPGGVKLARIFVNQTGTGTPVALPDLFMDDVVVQVTDGHNLVGNANFEGGFTDGWTGGGATVAINSALAKTGTNSLSVSGRTAPSAGPSYALPIGAAEYIVTFEGLHTGASPHGLVLQPTYTCLGGTPILPPPIATAAAVAANTWTPLTGTVAFPPANAAAGCQLTDAAVYLQQAESGTCGGTVECPDLYVDDVSIVIAP